MVFGHQPGQVEEDKEGMETIRRFGYNIAKLIKKIN
jgi:hypothetical protein